MHKMITAGVEMSLTAQCISATCFEPISFVNCLSEVINYVITKVRKYQNGDTTSVPVHSQINTVSTIFGVSRMQSKD